jgi:CHAD domain-containing protein
LGWVKKQLKQIRHAANDARDLDVLIQRLEKQSGKGTQHWLNTARAERSKAQRAVITVWKRLKHRDRFAHRIHGLLKCIGLRPGNQDLPCFGQWAREQFRPELERFFDAVPSIHADEAELHHFRIRGKELRYSLELLSSAFPTVVQTKFYPIVETIQDQLGEINDRSAAKERLQGEIDAAENPGNALLWRHLLKNECRQFDRACREFWNWCTPQFDFCRF